MKGMKNMNPMGFLKIKPLFERFTQDHPKLLMFLSAAAGEVSKDSIVEITVMNAEGYKMRTNIKVNENDVELFGELKKMMNK